ncbi:Bestrophin, RFP-TM, chloride channel-domain-containing protein [Mycena galopus ATCC 62051]|nr:Bestrophin, RFP-TM, chloride channel-domain-containing protein [Mycena galopus ATCC 62051]
MSVRKVHGKRSFTGNHSLLPAARPEPPPFIPKVPPYAFLKWTLGRGSVIWKIWPAVLLHALFATAIVYSYFATGQIVQIPNVMLTVMAAIGFVISYRAMSGHDGYWMGRTAWTDVIRNARIMGRLIWYHVPIRLTPLVPGTPKDTQSTQEMAKLMAEKYMALDLIEAFAVSLKHHLRGEVGIYYQDLYDLVRPLHDFTDPENPRPTVASAVPAQPVAVSTAPPPPSSSAASTSASSTLAPTSLSASTSTSASASGVSTSTSGNTLKVNLAPATSSHATKRPPATGHASCTSIHQPLLPASNPGAAGGVLNSVSPEVIPFAAVATNVGAWIRGFWKQAKEDRKAQKILDRSSRRMRNWSGPIHPQGLAQLEEFEIGENLPEEILRCLSEWVSVLEERGTVPGTSLGSILGGIMQFEISLTTLEHILTTPLPFIYSVHIRSVVWLYLFMLPLQLVNDFGWHTVPAVCVGAFVYLGFLAAGEEIEQPFGYDDNDLDLDMFCRDIIRQDIRCLKRAPCLNAWFPPKPAVSAPETSGPGTGEGGTAKTAKTGNGNGNGKDTLHAYGGNYLGPPSWPPYLVGHLTARRAGLESYNQA